jgi:hypothetical protein
MANIQPVQIIDEDGKSHTVYIETKINTLLDDDHSSLRDGDTDRQTYGVLGSSEARIEEIHRAIRLYAKYAIGAFRNLGVAEVEELNLKFGLKISGKGGIPVLAEASSEGNFEISVKCKFPKHQ